MLLLVMLVAVMVTVFFEKAGCSLDSLSFLLTLFQTVVTLVTLGKEVDDMAHRLLVGSGAHGAVQGL